MPGEHVLYQNEDGSRLVQGIYSNILVQRYGPPVARDALNPRNIQQIVQVDTDDWYLRTAIRFTHAANYVRADRESDIDLL